MRPAALVTLRIRLPWYGRCDVDVACCFRIGRKALQQRTVPKKFTVVGKNEVSESFAIVFPSNNTPSNRADTASMQHG